MIPRHIYRSNRGLDRQIYAGVRPDPHNKVRADPNYIANNREATTGCHSPFILSKGLPDHYIVTNSSETEGCSAMVRSKSALVAPIPTAIAAI